MNFQKKRAMTPKGEMSGNGSGPAIMMMPSHIRATFMPNPPIKHLPSFKRHVLQSDNYITEDEEDDAPVVRREKKAGPSGVTVIPTSFPRKKRGAGIAGVASFLQNFERTAPPPRTINPTPRSLREARRKSAQKENEARLAPIIEAYRAEQKGCGGEHPVSGMNCYNTLFVGRIAYEVTERKLLREMEAFGPVKDLKLVTDRNGKSAGYAFVEYEHEEDMKRAYRGADGMRLEGRPIVADVERGHTVPNWLPRRLGGGLGGTRLVLLLFDLICTCVPLFISYSTIFTIHVLQCKDSEEETKMYSWQEDSTPPNKMHNPPK
jgi:U1 small nuclear ribonucleoprotein